jgi:hypothetical protein
MTTDILVAHSILLFVIEKHTFVLGCEAPLQLGTIERGSYARI